MYLKMVKEYNTVQIHIKLKISYQIKQSYLQRIKYFAIANYSLPHSQTIPVRQLDTPGTTKQYGCNSYFNN